MAKISSFTVFAAGTPSALTYFHLHRQPLHQLCRCPWAQTCKRLFYVQLLYLVITCLISVSMDRLLSTIDPHSIATEMSAFASKSSRNQNDIGIMIAIIK